jgi:hypothetical protein
MMRSYVKNALEGSQQGRSLTAFARKLESRKYATNAILRLAILRSQLSRDLVETDTTSSGLS